MPDSVVSYPFDPTGQAATNRIIGEQVVVLPKGDRLFHFSMPQFAPFFEEGAVLKLRDVDNNVIPLVKGVHFYFSHKYADASLATMHPIWGSISWLQDIVGTLIIDYNTLGGIWTLSAEKIIEILTNTTQNPRITTWEMVTERPVDFPVIDHPWNLDDMVGQKEILEVLNNFYEAYLTSIDPEGGGGSSIVLEHINNQNNPHKVTANQTGAYSYAQMDQMLLGYVTATGTAYNSDRFNGMTYNAAKTDILSGQAADSLKLGGKTLNEIMAQLQAAAGDAETLQGKSLTALMADVKTTKVDDATSADTAKDSEKLNGKSLQQILADLGSVQPTLAQDSQKVYGLTQTELFQRIWDTQSYDGDKVTISGVTPIHQNNGGTQDQNYSYLLLGSFPLPIVDPNEATVHYDPTQRNYPCSAIIAFMYENTQIRCQVEFTIGANQVGDVIVRADDSFSTTGAPNNLPFYIGARKGPEVLALDGVTKGWNTEFYIKFRKDSNVDSIDTFMNSKGTFLLDKSDEVQLFDYTNVNLNSVTWRTPIVGTNQSEIQAAFDNLADQINTLIQTPAA